MRCANIEKAAAKAQAAAKARARAAEAKKARRAKSENPIGSSTETGEATQPDAVVEVSQLNNVEEPSADESGHRNSRSGADVLVLDSDAREEPQKPAALVALDEASCHWFCFFGPSWIVPLLSVCPSRCATLLSEVSLIWCSVKRKQGCIGSGTAYYRRRGGRLCFVTCHCVWCAQGLYVLKTPLQLRFVLARLTQTLIVACEDDLADEVDALLLKGFVAKDIRSTFLLQLQCHAIAIQMRLFVCLLCDRINANCEDDQGYTPVMIAADQGSTNALEALLFPHEGVTGTFGGGIESRLLTPQSCPLIWHRAFPLLANSASRRSHTCPQESRGHGFLSRTGVEAVGMRGAHFGAAGY